MWMVEPDITQQVVSLKKPTPSVCARAATVLSVRARSSERLESHVVSGTRVFYLGVFVVAVSGLGSSELAVLRGVAANHAAASCRHQGVFMCAGPGRLSCDQLPHTALVTERNQ